MVSRRQLARDVWANMRFRLSGSTDAGTDELRQRILDAIAGQRVVDLARLGPDVLAGILPLLYREVLDEAYAHQDAGRPGVHRHRRVAGAGRAAGARAGARRRHRDAQRGARRRLHRAGPRGPFTYREGKAEAIRELADARGHRPRGVVRVLGLRVRPADAARGRPPGGGEPGPRARAGGAREEGWRIMRFDKLARRLQVAAAPWRAWRCVGGGRRLRGRAGTPPAAPAVRSAARRSSRGAVSARCRSVHARDAHAAVAGRRGPRRRRSARDRPSSGARAAGRAYDEQVLARDVLEHRAS